MSLRYIRRIELHVSDEAAGDLDHCALELAIIDELRKLCGFAVDLDVNVGGRITYLDTMPHSVSSERPWNEVMDEVEEKIMGAVSRAIAGMMSRKLAACN